MSEFLSNISDVFMTAIGGTPRGIGGVLLPDCVINEHHTDRMEVTHHPVEAGANISDHCYMLPFELTLRYGWSNSSPANVFSSELGPLALLTGFGGSEDYVTQVYEFMQGMQQSKSLWQVSTGKRFYVDMLITELETETDASSEYSLIISIQMQQIIIASTSAAQLPANSQMKNPAQTGGTTDSGAQQAQPTTAPSATTNFNPSGNVIQT